MCKENSYAKMEKLEAQILYVGVQDRALSFALVENSFLSLDPLLLACCRMAFQLDFFFYAFPWIWNPVFFLFLFIVCIHRVQIHGGCLVIVMNVVYLFSFVVMSHKHLCHGFKKVWVVHVPFLQGSSSFGLLCCGGICLWDLTRDICGS